MTRFTSRTSYVRAETPLWSGSPAADLQIHDVPRVDARGRADIRELPRLLEPLLEVAASCEVDAQTEVSTGTHTSHPEHWLRDSFQID